MKKNIVFKVLFSLVCLCFLFSSVKVNAKEVLETAIAPGKTPSSPASGKIILYDDYMIAFDYEFRVKDIKVWVCANDACLKDNAQIDANQTYIGGTTVEFDLTQYLVAQDDAVTYTIKAIGDFKYQESDAIGSLATLTYQVEIEGKKVASGKDEDVFNNSNDALLVVNKWIIPGIYIVLAITFIIKGILLCIDLIRYSDHPDIRRDKIHGFIYIFVGLLVVFIINSTVGFITGLFG